MSEDQPINPMDVFTEESTDGNLQVQVTAIQKLATVAVVLDVERTRSELMPYLEEYLDNTFLHDEVLLTLAEQLDTFVPFVGGPEHVACIFRLLEKLCITDETVVRERAVESFVKIASNLEAGLLEREFVPLIEKLASDVWFTSKCSASGLFTVCYPKVSPENQEHLRALFCSLIQDEQPMVRRTVAANLVAFSNVISLEDIKETFIPMLDTLVKDSHDSLRIIAVDVAISFAEKLVDDDVEELLLAAFQALAADVAWRVRCKVAGCIDQIQKVAGPKTSKDHLVTMYQNLCKDEEPQVREEAAKNIVKFCEYLKEYCKSKESFEEVVKEWIVPLIKRLYEDKNDYVRAAIAWYVMPFCSLIDSEIVKNDLLPLVKYTIEHEQYPVVKENIARNLDSLIGVMGMANVMDSIQKLMEDLIYTSDSKWRIRRDVLLTFLHVCKQCNRDFFNEKLKDIYVRLLYDPVFAVRKTAPLILPILIKYFGTDWAYGLVPTILAFAQENNYLHRYIPIFAIDEIVEPTLDMGRVDHLGGLKRLCLGGDAEVKGKAARMLARVKTLQRLLKKALEQDWVEEYKEKVDVDDYPPENIKMYAEDIYDAFVANGSYGISEVTAESLKDDEIYIAGVLYMSIKYFLETLHRLLLDDVQNVTVKAKCSLLAIIRLSKNLEAELNEEWVERVCGQFSEGDLQEIEEEIAGRISGGHAEDFEEIHLDFTMQEPSEENDIENEIVEIFDAKLESLSK